jgi:hypothetical protein
MFGGNGVLLGFTISNPKYLEGPSGFNGHDLPFLGSNGCLTKIMSISLGIFICILTRSFPLEFVVKPHANNGVGCCCK